MEQIWRKILDSKYYEVSNMGRIRCLGGTIMRSDGKPYRLKAYIMTPQKTRCGYLLIALHCDLNIRMSVHRLVMQTFCPCDNMENLQVNHIDGNKANNCLTNLQWVTRQQNMQHAIANGLWTPTYASNHNPNLKLSDKDIEEIRELLQSKKYKQCEIARMYNVTESTISTIKHNRRRFA